MSRVLTKRHENFNHRFHRFTQIFLFSAFSASLRFIIFAEAVPENICLLISSRPQNGWFMTFARIVGL